jgi:hypothetical protein
MMDRAMQNAPFKFEPKDYYGFFARVGWRPRVIRYLAEEADGLNRPPAFPVKVKLLMRVMGLFMSRARSILGNTGKAGFKRRTSL